MQQNTEGTFKFYGYTEPNNVSSGGDISLFAGGESGTISLRAASAVNINSDLNVSGSIISKQSVSAVENVTAGMKLSSNLVLVVSEVKT